MFGTWLANGYSDEISFSWLSPQVREVGALLVKWLPVLAIGVWGMIGLAWRRRDLLLITLFGCTFATIYISASWWGYEVARRTALDNLAPIAISLTVGAEAVRRVRLGAEWVALALPALWNLPFLMIGAPSTGVAGLFSE